MEKALLLLICCCYFVAASNQHGFKWHPGNEFRNDPFSIDGKLGKRDTCTIPVKCAVAITTCHKSCQRLRIEDIKRARFWYKITDDTSTIAFPLAKQIPWLDQTIGNMQYYYALDQFESRYLILLSTWLGSVTKYIGPTFVKAFSSYPFVSNDEYVALYVELNKAVSKLNAPQYFGNPSQYPDFTDHIKNGKWQTDEAFVQRRLAGECPFLMKKVTKKGNVGIKLEDLRQVLNYNAIESLKLKVSTTKTLSINEAIDAGRLFVVYMSDMNDIETAPDLLESPNERVLRSLKSQITLFVLKEDGEFAVVAIQTDSQTDAKVLTPLSNADEWQVAKAEVELTAHSYCQAKLHLGGIHWVTTVYCLTFRRHLSTQHPLYEFFKFHCEGTIPHISQAYPEVLGSDGATNIFYTMGSKGTTKLSIKEYDERNYETFTFENFIEGNGLDDERIKYYPFRDDAKIILNEFKMFANELVNSYYRTKNIRRDKELQSWVAELSAHGQGKGNMVGFPQTFKRNHQLKTFIKRFLWYNIFHVSANYPTAPNFMPITPSKLYKNTTDTPTNLFQSLLGGDLAPKAVLKQGIIGNFRANRIFDYFRQVSNPKFNRIVQKYYYRLHQCVQKQLAKRNAQRKSKNQLGYQYIEPKWLTNSIHI